jgi:hypothetical protein
MFKGECSFPISPHKEDNYLSLNDQIVKIFERFEGINPNIDFSYARAKEQQDFLVEALTLSQTTN